MSQEIRTVVVIGRGVIGMSWAVLFLSQGPRVIITDPATEAQERFKQYLSDAWPSIAADQPDSFASNYDFVEDVVPRLAEADLVQESKFTETPICLTLVLDLHY
jgi:3-hydroxyacyl-CoA dehydrogenase